MDCILFRHGIAVDWQDWQREDRSRPLTDEGIEKTRKAAKGLVRLRVTPTQLLCSPYLRTRQTADILKETLDCVGQPQQYLELQPDASPEKFLNMLASFSGDDCVFCVGHEPHLGHTAGIMLLGQAVSGLSFKKAGACCIRFHGKPRLGNGVLQWWLEPAQLRKLAKP
ncbi:MAG: hypothetical protein F4201_05805 [Nitrospira sp. SB0677_bin_15]|nr:hypothetical protein [Nitrospira sp. SB0677_bin_15]